MKTRKFLSMLIAMAMILSLTAVPSFAASGGSDITLPGDVEAYDPPDVFKVTLPTTMLTGFQLDPQGLLGATFDPNTGLHSGLTPNEKVQFGTNDFLDLIVLNNSSVPIQFGVEFQVTGDVEAKAFATTWANASAGDNEVAFQVTAAQNNVVGSTGTIASSVSGTVAASFANNKQHIQYWLPSANYHIVKDPHPAAQETNGGNGTYGYAQILNGSPSSLNESGQNGTGIRIEGKINLEDSWSAFGDNGTKTIGIALRFGFNKSEAATQADAASVSSLNVVTGAFGAVGPTATTLATPGEMNIGTAPGPTIDITIPTRANSNENVIINVSAAKASVWAAGNPLVIQMPVGTNPDIRVSSSVANLPTHPWAKGTDWTYDETTRILTITRVANGLTFGISDGPAISRTYDVRFAS